MNNTMTLNDVSTRRFVVGSFDLRTNVFSMAASPVVHASRELAMAEANRLAKMNPGKAFVALQLAGGVVAQSVTLF